MCPRTFTYFTDLFFAIYIYINCNLVSHRIWVNCFSKLFVEHFLNKFFHFFSINFYHKFSIVCRSILLLGRYIFILNYIILLAIDHWPLHNDVRHDTRTNFFKAAKFIVFLKLKCFVSVRFCLFLSVCRKFDSCLTVHHVSRAHSTLLANTLLRNGIPCFHFNEWRWIGCMW